MKFPEYSQNFFKNPSNLTKFHCQATLPSQFPLFPLQNPPRIYTKSSPHTKKVPAQYNSDCFKRNTAYRLCSRFLPSFRIANFLFLLLNFPPRNLAKICDKFVTCRLLLPLSVVWCKNVLKYPENWSKNVKKVP